MNKTYEILKKTKELEIIADTNFLFPDDSSWNGPVAFCDAPDRQIIWLPNTPHNLTELRRIGFKCVNYWEAA